MKRTGIIGMVLSMSLALSAQEFKVITTVESIVPMGIGRSRMLDNQESIDYKNFTTSRDEGKDSKQKNVDRSEAKIDNLEETKLLNFYSGVGINFQNIASNDAMITSKLNEMSKEGWQLLHIASGVESECGGNDGKGIFITRYYFKRKTGP